MRGPAAWLFLAWILGLGACSKGEVQVRGGDPAQGLQELKRSRLPSRLPPQPGAEAISVWLEDRRWEFRPWVEDFKRRVAAGWEAQEGAVADGGPAWTEFALVVAREGRILRSGQVGAEGPPELHRLSLAAVTAVERCLPLPSDLKADTLALKVRLDYRALKR